MTHLVSTKTRFVTMTSVAALMALGLSGTSAQAACTKVVKLVTCTGTTLAFVDATAGVTVQVETSAIVNSRTGATAPAIRLLGSGATVNNDGTINAAAGGYGVSIEQGGTIKNLSNGIIIGGKEVAVVIQNGPAVIENAGTITNGLSDAIVTSTGNFKTTITNRTGGKIASSNRGIVLLSFGKDTFGDKTTVTNETGAQISGDIGIEVSGSTGQDATIINNGSLVGRTFSIKGGDATLDIVNNGSIKGSLSLGNEKSFVHNNASGSIDGDIIGGAGYASIANAGNISGKLDLGSGGSIVENYRTGVIVKNIKGLGGDDVILNDGRIGADMAAPIEIDLGNGKNSLVNSATGNIFGKVMLGAGNDKIQNDGRITGSLELGSGYNILINSGKLDIVTGVQKGILGDVTGAGGVDDITNSGFMGGNVALGGGDNILTNNAGGSIAGVIITTSGEDTVTNNAGAKILGGITVGTGDDTVTNSGSIAGNIDLGDGKDSLILNIGMSVTGMVVDGGSGTDRLVLAGGLAGESQTFDNTITNFETLIKNDAGKWVLGRNYGFTTSEINGGVLEIGKNFTLTASVGVKGGVLTGAGKVAGDVTVTGPGVLRPGDGSTGVLTVQGDVTVGAGSFVDVSVGPGLDQTQLAVTGNVNLGNGTLRVTVAPGFYKGNASYDVITAGGAVNLKFASTDLPKATRFTKFNVNYAPKAVQVQVEKLNYGDVVGDTYNRQQTGDGLFRGTVGSAVASDMAVVAEQFEGLPVGSHGQALDSLSGDVYPAMQALQERIAKNFRDVAGNRAHLFLEGTEVWGDILSTNQTIRSDGNGDQSKGDMHGAIVGMEQGFGYAKIGVFAGYGQGGTKLNQHLSSGKNNQILGGAYAGVNYHGLVVSGQFSYGQGHNEVKRHIAVGSVQRNVTSKEKVRMLGGNASIGYEINLGVVRITPGLGFDFTHTQSNGFEEKGNGGDVALEAKRHSSLVVSGEAGLRVSASWNLGAINIAPYVSGKFSRQVAGNSYRDRDVAFQGNPTETGFNVRSADAGKNRLVVGGGLAIGVGMVKLELGYSQDVTVGGSKEDSRNFTAGLGFHW